MKAVILAAGVGKRMLPLTEIRPKPLVEIGNKSILAHILEALPPEIDEVVLIVGYKAEMIETVFGDTHNGRRITYITQEKPEGTYKAVSLARPHISGRFLLMNADDIHGASALREALLHPLALIAATHEEPQHFGVVSLGEEGTLLEIVEKPAVPPTNLVSTGAMVLDERIFNYEVEASSSGEYYLPDALQKLARDARVEVVVQDLWLPVGRPEDIEPTANRLKDIEGKSRP